MWGWCAGALLCFWCVSKRFRTLAVATVQAHAKCIHSVTMHKLQTDLRGLCCKRVAHSCIAYGWCGAPAEGVQRQSAVVFKCYKVTGGARAAAMVPNVHVTMAVCWVLPDTDALRFAMGSSVSPCLEKDDASGL